MSDEQRPRTTMWLDDLAIVAASGVVAAPRAWLAVTLALLLVLGPWGLPGAIALQVACALLIGALLPHVLRRTPFSAKALWALPLAALGAQGLLTAAGGDGALGVPFAVLSGCLLAAVGVAQGLRLRPPVDTVLLAAGVIAVFVWKEHADPFRGGLFDLATGALFALGVAAISLRASGWGPTPDEGLPRRSIPGRATAWIWWGLVPAILLSVPTPSGWQWTSSIGAAHLFALFIGCVARHVVRVPEPATVSLARRRLAASVERSPASAVLLVVLAAGLLLDARLALGESVRPTLGGHMGWLFENTDDVSVGLVAVAVLAHGPARKLRGVVTLLLLVFLLPTARVLLEISQYLLDQSIPKEYVWEIVRPILVYAAVVSAVPLVIARFVPRTARRLGPVEPALLVLALALPPVLAVLDPSSVVDADSYESLLGPFEVPWFTGAFVLLFLRLATTPITGRVLAVGALLAALVSAITHVAVRDAMHLQSTLEPATLLGHVLNWGMAAVGVCVARLLAPVPAP